MKFCIYCGQPLEEGDRFCQACGRSLVEEPAGEARNEQTLEAAAERGSRSKGRAVPVIAIIVIAALLGAGGYFAVNHFMGHSSDASRAEAVHEDQAAYGEGDDAAASAGTEEAEAVDSWYYLENAGEGHGYIYEEADAGSGTVTKLKNASEDLVEIRADKVLGDYVHGVTDDGTEGWMKKADLVRIKDYKEYEGASTVDAGTYVNSSSHEAGIAIHPTPANDNVTLKRVPRGKEFEVFATVDSDAGTYGYVEYDGLVGWYNMDYAQDPEEYAEYGGYEIGKKYTTKKKMFLRSNPYKGDNDITVIKKGKKLKALDIYKDGDDIWIEVKYGSERGWAAARYDGETYIK